jgi:hypothetical protein
MDKILMEEMKTAPSLVNSTLERIHSRIILENFRIFPQLSQ